MKYFLLLSDRKTVLEISKEDWEKIWSQNFRWANKRKIARMDDSDVYLTDGRNGFWISLKQLTQVLGKEEA